MPTNFEQAKKPVAGLFSGVIKGLARAKYMQFMKDQKDQMGLANQQQDYENTALSNAYNNMNNADLPYHERIDNWNFIKDTTQQEIPKPTSPLLPFS